MASLFNLFTQEVAFQIVVIIIIAVVFLGSLYLVFLKKVLPYVSNMVEGALERMDELGLIMVFGKTSKNENLNKVRQNKIKRELQKLKNKTKEIDVTVNKSKMVEGLAPEEKQIIGIDLKAMGPNTAKVVEQMRGMSAQDIIQGRRFSSKIKQEQSGGGRGR